MPGITVGIDGSHDAHRAAASERCLDREGTPAENEAQPY
jgi:hypothetical protein